jgi:hypothetical protein
MWKSPLQLKVFLLLEFCFCSLSARSSGKASFQWWWKTWGIEFFSLKHPFSKSISSSILKLATVQHFFIQKFAQVFSKAPFQQEHRLKHTSACNR